MKGSNLAEQALTNLVNQFARSMDFLRELVQNSIDAGSPRIEVWADYEPGTSDATDGVLKIHVDDWGEGMDETVIDEQLTRLFSSTKENDLTKIGKFGIGFTSIFAIQPDAVLLRTGRHGENWELLFHEDRSFEKHRIEEPVDGTRITLFKRMPEEKVDSLIREARWVLSYWCEHSNVPVSFWDRTRQQDVEHSSEDDPFAAFEAPSMSAGPEKINSPLSLQADLSVSLQRDDVEVVIGYARTPRYGFYNGGLTLLSSGNTETLGDYALVLGHTSFKIKYDKLEHTLTRDNVLQDKNWEHAMQVVLAAAEHLRRALLKRTEQECLEGRSLSLWHNYLAAECAAQDQAIGQWSPVQAASSTELPSTFRSDWSKHAILRTYDLTPTTPARIAEQERSIGCILYDSGAAVLRDALGRDGTLLLEDLFETRKMLDAATSLTSRHTMPFRQRTRPTRQHFRADEIFVLPGLVPVEDWSAQEVALLEATQTLLRQALRFQVIDRIGMRLTLKLGDFGGPELGRKDVLALNGPEEGGVFQRAERTLHVSLPRARYSAIGGALPSFLRWRCLLVNRYHPFFQTQLLAGIQDLPLAAHALGQALLHVEAIEPEATFHNLVNLSSERL